MQKCKYNDGSNFDRQGQWVIGNYLNMCFVTGIVTESRVKYGGVVQHTVVSDSPTTVDRTGEIRPIGTHFLIDEKALTHAEVIVAGE